MSLFFKFLLLFSFFSARRLQQLGMCLSNISLLYSIAGLSDQECDVCPVDVNGASGNDLPTLLPSRGVHSRERTHLSHPPSVDRHRVKVHDQDISHDSIFSTGNFPYRGNSVFWYLFCLFPICGRHVSVPRQMAIDFARSLPRPLRDDGLLD